MQELLASWFPHVTEKPSEFYESICETLIMTGWAGALMFLFGLILGVALVVTKEHGILQNRAVFQVLDKLINLFRSIPFVILIALLMNVTRLIMGTRIGVRGVIVPLVAGSAPFFARQVETALAGVDPGLIEAAKAMGCRPAGIILRVYLKEGAADIARGATITLINLIGLTAMAGYVGAGGLGDYRLRARRGRQRPPVHRARRPRRADLAQRAGPQHDHAVQQGLRAGRTDLRRTRHRAGQAPLLPVQHAGGKSGRDARGEGRAGFEAHPERPYILSEVRRTL